MLQNCYHILSISMSPPEESNGLRNFTSQFGSCNAINMIYYDQVINSAR